MNPIKESIIQEAQLLMQDHPSKDVRWFAKSVCEYLTGYKGKGSRNLVIMATRLGKPYTFYCRDNTSGGYPYYSESLSLAHFMNEKEAALQMKIIKDKSADDQRTVYNSGEKRPNLELSCALDLDYDNPEESVTFTICEIELKLTTESFSYTGKIEKQPVNELTNEGQKLSGPVVLGRFCPLILFGV